MKLRMSDKVALVTGGGSGIGASAVRALVQQGAKVAVVDRTSDAAKAIATELGSSALAITADVSDERAVEDAFNAAVAHFGRIDVSVHAAGFGASCEIVDQELSQWRAMMAVDLDGVFICTKHAARQMLRQGSGGAIVNVSSTNAVQPGQGLGAYCAAKAGVAMLTQVAVLELAQYGIRVNCVGPGLTRTPLSERFFTSEAVLKTWMEAIPAGRGAESAEIASAIVWLASDEAAYVNGESIYVDGGLRGRSYPPMEKRSPSYSGSRFVQGLGSGKRS